MSPLFKHTNTHVHPHALTVHSHTHMFTVHDCPFLSKNHAPRLSLTRMCTDGIYRKRRTVRAAPPRTPEAVDGRRHIDIQVCAKFSLSCVASLAPSPDVTVLLYSDAVCCQCYCILKEAGCPVCKMLTQSQVRTI